MTEICPVCNGLKQMIAQCSSCKQLVADMGRIVDYADPYSPYRDMDDHSLYEQAAYVDSISGCLHWTYCRGCSRSIAYEVPYSSQ